jgi:NADPH-dependent curcumin reductase CurA
LKWIYTKRPEGEVTEENYTLVETEIPIPKENEILVESKCIA